MLQCVINRYRNLLKYLTKDNSMNLYEILIIMILSALSF